MSFIGITNQHSLLPPPPGRAIFTQYENWAFCTVMQTLRMKNRRGRLYSSI